MEKFDRSRFQIPNPRIVYRLPENEANGHRQKAARTESSDGDTLFQSKTGEDDRERTRGQDHSPNHRDHQLVADDRREVVGTGKPTNFQFSIRNRFNSDVSGQFGFICKERK